MSRANKISIFWFRRDIRLNDNHGLFQALKENNSVLPVFIFDEEILGKLTDKEDKRVCFIHDNLQKIKKELEKIGSSLLILHGKTDSIFEHLCEIYDIEAVYANKDYEPQAIARDKRIKLLLAAKGIKFKAFKDQVIFEEKEVVKADGLPYTIYTPYSKVWKQKLSEKGFENYPSENLLKNCIVTTPFELLTLEKIGFKPSLYTQDSNLPNEKIIRNYHETRNLPSINGTSNLSVHLRFGTISIRSLVSTALALNEHWLNELIWREFFMTILFHYPNVVTESFKKKYDKITWRNNEKEFEAWCKGNTGYPIVDAGMRELNETGLMHNRVRMIVASFLTKHLLIDWRWGEAYFAQKLMDYELSSNNGNWQWSAGSGCDSAPYFRIFNPYEQVKKFDPKLTYIKKWVKNLNSFDYPAPIVEHKFARERVLKVYKTALEEIE